MSRRYKNILIATGSLFFIATQYVNCSGNFSQPLSGTDSISSVSCSTSDTSCILQMTDPNNLRLDVGSPNVNYEFHLPFKRVADKCLPDIVWPWANPYFVAGGLDGDTTPARRNYISHELNLSSGYVSGTGKDVTTLPKCDSRPGGSNPQNITYIPDQALPVGWHNYYIFDPNDIRSMPQKPNSSTAQKYKFVSDGVEIQGTCYVGTYPDNDIQWELDWIGTGYNGELPTKVYSGSSKCIDGRYSLFIPIVSSSAASLASLQGACLGTGGNDCFADYAVTSAISQAAYLGFTNTTAAENGNLATYGSAVPLLVNATTYESFGTPITAAISNLQSTSTTLGVLDCLRSILNSPMTAVSCASSPSVAGKIQPVDYHLSPITPLPSSLSTSKFAMGSFGAFAYAQTAILTTNSFVPYDLFNLDFKFFGDISSAVTAQTSNSGVFPMYHYNSTQSYTSYYGNMADTAVPIGNGQNQLGSRHMRFQKFVSYAKNAPDPSYGFLPAVPYQDVAEVFLGSVYPHICSNPNDGVIQSAIIMKAGYAQALKQAITNQLQNYNYRLKVSLYAYDSADSSQVRQQYYSSQSIQIINLSPKESQTDSANDPSNTSGSGENLCEGKSILGDNS